MSDRIRPCGRTGGVVRQSQTPVHADDGQQRHRGDGVGPAAHPAAYARDQAESSAVPTRPAAMPVKKAKPASPDTCAHEKLVTEPPIKDVAAQRSPPPARSENARPWRELGCPATCDGGFDALARNLFHHGIVAAAAAVSSPAAPRVSCGNGSPQVQLSAVSIPCPPECS